MHRTHTGNDDLKVRKNERASVVCTFTRHLALLQTPISTVANINLFNRKFMIQVEYII